MDFNGSSSSSLWPATRTTATRFRTIKAFANSEQVPVVRHDPTSRQRPPTEIVRLGPRPSCTSAERHQGHVLRPAAAAEGKEGSKLRCGVISANGERGRVRFAFGVRDPAAAPRDVGSGAAASHHCLGMNLIAWRFTCSSGDGDEATPTLERTGSRPPLRSNSAASSTCGGKLKYPGERVRPVAHLLAGHSWRRAPVPVRRSRVTVPSRERKWADDGFASSKRWIFGSSFPDIVEGRADRGDGVRRPCSTTTLKSAHSSSTAPTRHPGCFARELRGDVECLFGGPARSRGRARLEERSTTDRSGIPWKRPRCASTDDRAHRSSKALVTARGRPSL